MTNTDDDTTAHGGGEINTSRSARRRAIETFEGGRDKVGGALSEAPLLMLAGGIAAGAVLASLLPGTRSETRAVRPFARRAKDSASAAYKAAKDTGGERLDALGINREKGEETIRSLLQGVGDAARASADAAMSAVRNKD